MGALFYSNSFNGPNIQRQRPMRQKEIVNISLESEFNERTANAQNEMDVPDYYVFFFLMGWSQIIY